MNSRANRIKASITLLIVIILASYIFTTMSVSVSSEYNKEVDTLIGANGAGYIHSYFFSQLAINNYPLIFPILTDFINTTSFVIFGFLLLTYCIIYFFTSTRISLWCIGLSFILYWIIIYVATHFYLKANLDNPIIIGSCFSLQISGFIHSVVLCTICCCADILKKHKADIQKI